MIDVSNIAKAAASAVERALDRAEGEATPVRSMVLMSRPDLSGDVDSVREWFAAVSDDTAVAAWIYYVQCFFHTLSLYRTAANSDGADAAEARELIADMAAFIRADLKKRKADEVLEIGEHLTSTGWKRTP